jgi:hypothetical protein
MIGLMEWRMMICAFAQAIRAGRCRSSSGSIEGLIELKAMPCPIIEASVWIDIEAVVARATCPIEGRKRIAPCRRG